MIIPKNLKRLFPYLFAVFFFLFLIIDFVIVIEKENAAQDSQNWVDHTYQVLNEAKALQVTTKNLQNIGRGYVLTGDSSYLNDLDSLEHSIRTSFQNLVLLTEHDLRQHPHMNILAKLVDERIQIIHQNIELKNSQGMAAVIRYVKAGYGKRNMQAIDNQIAIVIAEESRLLDIRKARNQKSRQDLEILFYILSAFAVAAGVVYIVLLRQNDKLQKEVERQKREIESKARRFEQLLENSFEGIVLLDEKLNYIYKSSFAEKLTGYKAEERDAKTGIAQIHPDDQSFFLKTCTEILQHPGQTREIYYRSLHRSNRYIWIHSFITNRLNEQDVQAIVFNFRDVTPQMELDQQKDAFLKMVSHELKTPLTGLKVVSHLLMDELQARSDFQNIEYLQRMKDQTNRLIRLINDLMDLNKIGDTGALFRPAVFNFIQLVEEVITDLQRITTTHRIHLRINKNTGNLPVFGDKERMVQVLDNLISNAVKYSPNAHDVNVFVTAEQDKVLCSVEDFGIGIEEEDRSKLFERFYRSKKSQTMNFPGLGIGLYITAEFIRAHQGNIWLMQKEGDGSIFTFNLPLHEDAL